ncbi:hypothetical protein FQZ97_874440 [compost metagenome]
MRRLARPGTEQPPCSGTSLARLEAIPACAGPGGRSRKEPASPRTSHKPAMGLSHDRHRAQPRGTARLPAGLFHGHSFHPTVRDSPVGCAVRTGSLTCPLDRWVSLRSTTSYGPPAERRPPHPTALRRGALLMGFAPLAERRPTHPTAG